MYWMYQAKTRFKISILNYALTSNHIHILLVNRGRENSIPKAMHLVLSRVAQEYNTRKKRTGPFWQDRYHATAVESGMHLFNCMVYIDLNMVRAGVVNHPRDYPFCGYQEISGKRKKYRLIDKQRLSELVEIDPFQLKTTYEEQISKLVDGKNLKKEGKWTSSLGVGSRDFVENLKSKMGVKAKNRVVILSKKDFSQWSLL